MVYKLKQIREQRHMTQEQLANASGISRATICLLEAGTEHNASMKTLLSLARALDTTVDNIFSTANA